MTVTIGFKTDVGRVREANEDAYAVLRRDQLDNKLEMLIVVADGMGGLHNGDIASGLVAQTVPECFHEVIFDDDRRFDFPRLLGETIMRANSKVWMRSIEKKEYRGMGTTCVAAIIDNDKLIVGNVGDSRAYLLREGKLLQITEDHSEVWQQVKAGNMTREQANRSKYRNSITKAIGLSTDVEPDIFEEPLKEGDTILLCSDGLTTEVGDRKIARIMATAPTPDEATDQLVNAALRHGGSDNVTVVVARYGEFTPLNLPDEPDDDEDDTPTDPSQEWKREPVASAPEPVRESSKSSAPAPRPAAEAAPVATAARPTPPRAEQPEKQARTNGASARRERQQRVERDEEQEEDWREPRMTLPPGFEAEETEDLMARGGGGLAVTLVVLLLLVVIAEAIAVGILFKNRTVQVISAAALVPTGETATGMNRDYHDPVLITKELLADAPLQVYDTDTEQLVYAVGQKSGKVIKIQPAKKGKVTEMGSLSPVHVASAPGLPTEFVMDSSGLRYQINPTLKCIDVYSGGTRVKQIGLGVLKAPTCLAVDHGAGIYVIDKHRLYKLDAIDNSPEFNLAPGKTEGSSLSNTEGSRGEGANGPTTGSGSQELIEGMPRKRGE